MRNIRQQFQELRNKEQIGIVDYLMKFNPKAVYWMTNNSQSFVNILEKTTISKKEDRFRVFKNLDKRLGEFLDEEIIN